MPTIQFSGLASGIDSGALIDSIIAARDIRNDIRRNSIDHLESENDALEELNTKLLSLSDLVDQFRTINGGGVDKKTSSSDSTVATAVAGSNAINSQFDLTTTSVASTGTASFDDSYSATDDPLAANASGTVTIGVDVGTGSNLVSVDIDITSSTTIQEYVDAFNADSNASGRVSAAVVNIGTDASPSYKVVFNSLEQGTDEGTIAFDVPGTGSFGGNSDLQNQTVDQATDAVFSISGIDGTITRSTNSVSDVITGLSFQLVDAGTATISVNNDADGTSDKVSEIVAAYNDIVEFVNENDIVTRVADDDRSDNSFGSLAKTRVDNDFLTAFRLDLSEASSSSGVAVTSFAEMGLSTNRDGTLSFDEDDFIEAVGEDPTGVAEVLTDFADAIGGNDGLINQYTKFDGFIDVAQEANNNETDNLNAAIAQLDRQNDKLRENLEGQFARLESISSELQNRSASLNSALAGL